MQSENQLPPTDFLAGTFHVHLDPPSPHLRITRICPQNMAVICVGEVANWAVNVDYVGGALICSCLVHMVQTSLVHEIAIDRRFVFGF